MCHKDAFIHKVSPFNSKHHVAFLSFRGTRLAPSCSESTLSGLSCSGCAGPFPIAITDFPETSTCAPRYLPASRHLACRRLDVACAGSTHEDPYLRISCQLYSYMDLQSVFRGNFRAPPASKHQPSNASLYCSSTISTPQIWAPFFISDKRNNT